MNFLIEEKGEEDEGTLNDVTVIMDKNLMNENEKNLKELMGFLDQGSSELKISSTVGLVESNIMSDSEEDPKKKSRSEKLKKAILEFVDTEKSYMEGLAKYIYNYKKKLEDPNLEMKKEVKKKKKKAFFLFSYHKILK